MKKILSFLGEARDEFKKVKWPSRKQTLTLTAWVIGVSVIVGIYVGVLDFGFKELIEATLR